LLNSANAALSAADLPRVKVISHISQRREIGIGVLPESFGEGKFSRGTPIIPVVGIDERTRVVAASVRGIVRNHLGGDSAGEFPIARFPGSTRDRFQCEKRLRPFVGSLRSARLSDGRAERGSGLVALTCP
jgi:hypothetical protein